MNTTTGETTTTSTHSNAMVWTAASLSICVLGVLGSLWLSIGMELKACPLCLYQRTFIMAVGGVLLTGLCTKFRNSPLLPLLALPAAAGGFGVAVFHEYLEAGGALECPAGLFGLGTAPQQSLGIFVLLVAALTVGACRVKGESGYGITAVIVAFVSGLLFAAGTIKSAPPMPATPTAPYEKPLDMCRPPFNP